MIARLSLKKASFAEAFHVRPIFFRILFLGKFFNISIKRGSYGGVVLDRPRIIVGEPQVPLELTNVIWFSATLKRQHFPLRRQTCAILQHMARKLNQADKEIGFTNRSNHLLPP